MSVIWPGQQDGANQLRVEISNRDEIYCFRTVTCCTFRLPSSLWISHKKSTINTESSNFHSRDFWSVNLHGDCVLAIQACGIQNDLINNFSHSKVLCDYYTDFKRERQMIKSHSYKLPANDKKGKIKKISPRLQWSPCCPAGGQRMNILAGNLIIPATPLRIDFAHLFRKHISQHALLCHFG